MLNLILSLLTALPAWPGVGGISGGHVHFQSVSTWVSPLYNRTLCHSEVEYRAVVSRCTKERGESGSCEESRKVVITQPVLSSKMVCARTEGENCTAWEEQPYYQSPERTVDLVDSAGNVRGKTKVVVPPCR